MKKNKLSPIFPQGTSYRIVCLNGLTTKDSSIENYSVKEDKEGDSYICHLKPIEIDYRDVSAIKKELIVDGWQ